MTKEELAALIDGREYMKEITKAEEAQAKADGLLVIFGYSDDNIEFRGAFSDEVGAYDGANVLICKSRALPSWEDFDKDEEEEVERYFADKKEARLITGLFSCDGYTWFISTEVPYAPFVIKEDGDTFCRGIVISVADLA